MPSPLNQQYTLQKLLERELSLLKSRFQLAHELKVKWLPNSSSNKSGEVIGKTIYIYEENEAKTSDTLKHEFVEYILTYELIAPYKKLVNKLISLFEEEMYEQKERLIEKLLRVIIS
jgi:hypothetical protein